MKRYILILLLISFYFSGKAQQIITGTVLSATSQKPLAGTSIKVKGQEKAESTDSNGQFRLSVTGRNVTIHVSFIGFTSQDIDLNLPLSRSLTVLLNPISTQLSEVLVSTGYQTLPKERSTGSFTKIDSKTFNQQVSTDVLSRLIGVAGGLTVDKGTNSDGKFVIRGLGTIMGPSDPLIVVDNFPYDGDINNINPNDVDNITILKDAAASSIWGAKAGNGVIVITTKKGKFNQPLTVEFNSNVTISAKPDLSYIRQISSSDFIDVEKMLFNQGYYTSQISDPSKPPLTPVVELLIKEANGTLSANQANTQINAFRNVDIRSDFSKYMYRNAFNQQYALNLRGGTDKLAWTTSGGYDRNLSMLDAGYNRANLRFQSVYKPLKKLQITTGIVYTKSNTTSGKPGYGDVTSKSGLYFFPYAKFADANGNAIPLVKDYEQTYLQTAGNGKLLDWNYYPLTDYQHAKSANNLSDMVINTGLNYQILKGFSADIKYQYERQQSTVNGLWDQNSYFARELVNRFTQIDASGNVNHIVPAGGVLDISNATLTSNNIRGQFNFDKSWGDHAVSAIAGGELRSAHTISNRNRSYGYDDNLLTYGNVDYANSYPDFTSGNYNFIPDNRDIGDQLTRYVSTFANAAYTYKAKYTFSLSARRDASNLFGLKTNDQWTPLWSAGTSWKLSDEPFYHVAFLPYLKLRATYGFSGNIDPAMVAATTIYYATTSPYTQTPLAQIRNYYNPELKWETSRIINLGADFRTPDSRISGSLEYYQKKGTNLFGTAILDYTGGIGSQVIKNTASMKGQGIDLEMTSLNIDQANFKWSTLFNFNYYKDHVTEYYLSSLQGSNFITTTTNVPVSGLPGKPVYAIFAYNWAGLDPLTGDPMGYLNGQVSKDYTAITGSGTQAGDLKYFGSAIPTKFGSLVNTFSYKSWSLSMSMVYKLGYYFRRTSVNYSDLFTNWQGNSDYAQRWQKPGDEIRTNVPSMVYPAETARDSFYAGSSVLVDKADHIRLQYVNLSYNLVPSIKSLSALKSLQVYFNASNLGILWRANKDHIDPDYNYGLYPLVNPRTYAMGIRGSF